MGKGSRIRRQRRMENTGFEESASERMTENFQKEIRGSQIWNQMVAEFGEEKAEKILKECKAEVKPMG